LGGDGFLTPHYNHATKLDALLLPRFAKPSAIESPVLRTN